ncbi:MAG: aminotransferase class III-fold pyridoxal phosphate-dependent enzyme [Spirochaetota bacterium]|nr:MAG: aminotransferase class III-fold pyridoxal phosphate-dependent enzyme [Spirochaetota bacterium]
MTRKELQHDLINDYKANNPKSFKLFQKNSDCLIKGGSHNARLFSPFPFYDAQCSGSKVKDIDGNTYIDFWQGHYVNILGHNPEPVLSALIKYMQQGGGLQTGFPGTHQGELARFIIKCTGADRIRFTTSGTLATMYAIMLSRAFTGKDLVLKVGGGWHGSQPFVLKGTFTYDKGFNYLESRGLLPETDKIIHVIRFNDINDLEEKFKKNGDRISCFIIEACIGVGGFIFASKEYLKRARELCTSHGALLIIDEVISGFRFHPGGLQSLYGMKPDLTVFGKVIGGGMPVSAVCGREDVMSQCSPDRDPDELVQFNGGTYSAHPASMLAGYTFITYLKEHAKEIYPKIGRLGKIAREGIEEIFTTHGFNVRCTGHPNGVTEYSSLLGVHFLKDTIDRLDSPDQAWNPEICDIELREEIFKLEMLKEGFHIMHGYGGISAAHTEEEIQASLDAVERIALRWKKYNIPRS